MMTLPMKSFNFIVMNSNAMRPDHPHYAPRFRRGASPVPSAGSRLELCVQPHRDDRHRSAVAIVGWVIDPLIIEAQMCGPEDRERIIRFDDLLGARVRQPPIADQDAEPAGVQVTLARGRYAVVDRGETERVV